MGTVVYGPGYIRTTQGILKLVEILVCFIGLLLVAIRGWTEDLQNAYIAGVVIGMVVSVILLILHISSAGKSLEGIIAFQIYFHILWFIYLLIVSAVLLSRHYNDKFQAGGAFGIIAAAVYLGDALDCFRNDPSPLLFVKS